MEEEFPWPTATVYKNFYDVANEQEFWQYMTEVFAPQLSSPNRLLDGASRLIGSARVRQLRVRTGGCPTTRLFEPMRCYSAYDAKFESRAEFGNVSLAAFNWRSASQLGAIPVLGRTQSYVGGGFALDLVGDAEQDVPALAQLQASNWVDAQTRLVVIDVTTFNQNINLFWTGQMLFEFLPSGGILPSATFRVLRLYRYPDTFRGRLQIGLELVVVIFVAFYCTLEIVDLVRDPMAFLTDGWNFLDVANLLLFFALFALRGVLAREFGKFSDTNRFFNFSRIVVLHSAHDNIVAFNGFLLFFKVLKYTRFSKRAIVIAKTIKHGVGALFSFLVIVLFILVGFAFMANISFGNDVSEYKTLGFSILSIFRALTSGVEFEKLWENNRLMGPLFFVAFVVIFIFILLNVFLAIISNSYDDIQTTYSTRETRTSVLMRSYFKRLAAAHIPARLVAFREAYLRKKAAEEARDIVLASDLNQDATIDRAEAHAMFADERGNAMRDAFGVGDADELFHVYDENQDGVIDESERRAMLEQLELRRQKYLRAMEDARDNPEAMRRLSIALNATEAQAVAAAAAAATSATSAAAASKSAARPQPHAPTRARQPHGSTSTLGSSCDSAEDDVVLVLSSKLDMAMDMLVDLSVNVAKLAERMDRLA